MVCHSKENIETKSVTRCLCGMQRDYFPFALYFTFKGYLMQSVESIQWKKKTSGLRVETSTS